MSQLKNQCNVSCLLSSMQQNRHIESHALHSFRFCGSFPITFEMKMEMLSFFGLTQTKIFILSAPQSDTGEATILKSLRGQTGNKNFLPKALHSMLDRYL